jgi:hypothetical protein
MKNQILSEEFIRMQKLAGIISEIKAVRGYGRGIIKLSRTDEDGEERDKEEIIVPKHIYRFTDNLIEYFQSEEPIIPEEEVFFYYLEFVLEDYVEKAKSLDLTDKDTRNYILQSIINDLYLYIRDNNAYSLSDTSPRNYTYDVFKTYLPQIFPNLKEDWNNYIERIDGFEALENNDYEYFIRTWLN